MWNLITGERRPLPELWLKSTPTDEELSCWRPHVCFIGENYDEYPLTESVEVCQSCEVALIIGTGGVIHTPVWLAERAQFSGAVVVNINPNPGKIDKVSELTFRGTASEYFQETSV